jgi:hypothetical protein
MATHTDENSAEVIDAKWSCPVGDPQGEDFRSRLDNVLVEIGEFNGRFVTQATAFLSNKLFEWGFAREESLQLKKVKGK